jgi:hypothetical protein
MKFLVRPWLFVLLLLLSCKSNKKDVTLYVVNNSRFLKDVNIEVVLEGDSIVNQKFTYSGVTPDYTTFVKTYSKGIYAIKVHADNMTKTDTFNLNNDIYIYISHDAVIKENGDTSKGLVIHKTYTKHQHY